MPKVNRLFGPVRDGLSLMWSAIHGTANRDVTVT
jgi:hypothetical protein